MTVQSSFMSQARQHLVPHLPDSLDHLQMTCFNIPHQNLILGELYAGISRTQDELYVNYIQGYLGVLDIPDYMKQKHSYRASSNIADKFLLTARCG